MPSTSPPLKITHRCQKERKKEIITLLPLRCALPLHCCRRRAAADLALSRCRHRRHHRVAVRNNDTATCTTNTRTTPPAKYLPTILPSSNYELLRNG